jgi:hypothetical protein
MRRDRNDIARQPIRNRDPPVKTSSVSAPAGRACYLITQTGQTGILPPSLLL